MKKFLSFIGLVTGLDFLIFWVWSILVIDPLFPIRISPDERMIFALGRLLIVLVLLILVLPVTGKGKLNPKNQGFLAKNLTVLGILGMAGMIAVLWDIGTLGEEIYLAFLFVAPLLIAFFTAYRIFLRKA